MNSADIAYIQFQIARSISEAKLRAAKDRARMDVAITARGRVACRITILSEYRAKHTAEPEPKGAA